MKFPRRNRLRVQPAEGAPRCWVVLRSSGATRLHRCVRPSIVNSAGYEFTERMLHQRALLFRDEESLELKERPRMLLLCEWIARLHVIGQRCRDVVLNLAVSRGYLPAGRTSDDGSSLPDVYLSQPDRFCACSTPTAGKIRATRVPPVAGSASSIRAPCSSAISRTMDRPRPQPSPDEPGTR